MPSNDRIRRPAVQIYAADDILANRHVLGMGNEALGIHIRLYCLAWLEPGVRADFDALARSFGVTRKRFDTLWKQIAPAWEERDGKLYCPEQEAKRAEHEAYVARQRNNGGKGGRPPKKPTGSGGETENNPVVSDGITHTEARKTSAPPPATAVNHPPTPHEGGSLVVGDEQGTSGTFDPHAFAMRVVALGNRGFRENEHLTSQGIIQSDASSHQVVHDWLAEGIPAAAIERCVYGLALVAKPRDRKISSLAYLSSEVRKAWAAEQAELAATTVASQPVGGSPAPSAQREAERGAAYETWRAAVEAAWAEAAPEVTVEVMAEADRGMTDNMFFRRSTDEVRARLHRVECLRLLGERIGLVMPEAA